MNLEIVSIAFGIPCSRISVRVGLESSHLTLDAGLSALESFIRGRDVIIWSDNRGAERATHKGRNVHTRCNRPISPASLLLPPTGVTKNFDQNCLVHSIWKYLIKINVDVWVARVPSKENISDLPSRLDSSKFCPLVKQFCVCVDSVKGRIRLHDAIGSSRSTTQMGRLFSECSIMGIAVSSRLNMSAQRHWNSSRQRDRACHFHCISQPLLVPEAVFLITSTCMLPVINILSQSVHILSFMHSSAIVTKCPQWRPNRRKPAGRQLSNSTVQTTVCCEYKCAPCTGLTYGHHLLCLLYVQEMSKFLVNNEFSEVSHLAEAGSSRKWPGASLLNPPELTFIDELSSGKRKACRRDIMCNPSTPCSACVLLQERGARAMQEAQLRTPKTR